jgi:hypothetical protein
MTIKSIAAAVDGSTSTFVRSDGTAAAASGGGVSDGDKGDITVTASGATWTIDAGVVTDAKVAAANKDGIAGTASMRTLGTGAQQAAAGNDARLSDARTPLAHVHAAADITSGTMATARLGSGTANSTTFLRGDQTWAAPVASAPATLPKIRLPPTFNHANLTATKTCTSNTSFAVYLGRADAAYTSVVVRLRVTTAAGTITWAEVAIATGTPSPGGNAALTRRGFTDTAAIVNSLGQKSITVSVSGIAAGDDIWAIVGAQATTALAVRAGLADDLQLGGQASAAATRPSTMGAGTTFTIEGATAACPWVGLQT